MGDRIAAARRLHLLGAALAALSFATVFLDPLASHVPSWLGLYGLSFVLLLALVPRLSGPPVATSTVVLGLVLWAALIRLPLLLATEPSLSDDVYRTVWEGRVVLAGENPYLLAPDAEELRGLSEGASEWKASINHPDLPAVYPPGAQWFFAAAAAGGLEPRGMRAAIVVLDLLLVGLLGLLLAAHGRRPEWAALYAWHPLVAVEVASSGHYEPLALLPMVAGLLLWRRGAVTLACVSWGLALAAKFVGVVPAVFVIAAALRRREWRKSALMTACVVLPLTLLSIPFALDGRLPLGSLGTYLANWSHNASVHALLTPLLGFHPARWVVAVALGLLLVALVFRPLTLEGRVLAITTGALICSPVVHPWYGLWLIVLLPLAPRLPLSLLSGLLPLSYLAWTSQAPGETWEPPGWVPVVEYGLPLLVLVGLWVRQRRRAPAAVPAP